MFRLVGWDPKTSGLLPKVETLIENLYARYKQTDRHSEAEGYALLVSHLRTYGVDDSTILQTAGYFYGRLKVRVWGALAQLSQEVQDIKKSGDWNRRSQYIHRLSRERAEFSQDEIDMLTDHKIYTEAQKYLAEHRRKIKTTSIGRRLPDISVTDFMSERVLKKDNFGFVTPGVPQPAARVWAIEGNVNQQPAIGIALITAANQIEGEAVTREIGMHLEHEKPTGEAVKTALQRTNQSLRYKRLASEGAVATVCVGPDRETTLIHAGPIEVQVWRSGQQMFSLQNRTPSFPTLTQSRADFGMNSFRLGEIILGSLVTGDVVVIVDTKTAAHVNTSDLTRIMKQQEPAQGLAEKIAQATGESETAQVVVYKIE